MDLGTQYLGLELTNPLVPSASPLSHSIDTAKELEDNGAAALIMYSLYEEALVPESEHMLRFLHEQDTGFGEADSSLPSHHDFGTHLDLYLENLSALKQALDIPVIASLNGITPGGWLKYAADMQSAGADALELNIYYVAGDIEQSGAAIERRYLDLLADLRKTVSLPINMKLSPAFSALGNMAKQLEAAGANGIALFNRFYQLDINIDNLRQVPSLHPSTSAEALLAMRWIAILYGRTKLSLGATGGIHTAEDAIKLLLAGADVVHLCSTLLNSGPRHIRVILQGIEDWMEQMGFESIGEVRGRVSQLRVADPAAFERATYVKILDGYTFGPGILR